MSGRTPTQSAFARASVRPPTNAPVEFPVYFAPLSDIVIGLGLSAGGARCDSGPNSQVFDCIDTINFPAICVLKRYLKRGCPHVRLPRTTWDCYLAHDAALDCQVPSRPLAREICCVICVSLPHIERGKRDFWGLRWLDCVPLFRPSEQTAHQRLRHSPGAYSQAVKFGIFHFLPHCPPDLDTKLSVGKNLLPPFVTISGDESGGQRTEESGWSVILHKLRISRGRQYLRLYPGDNKDKDDEDDV
jgi:hypothetical protein